MVIVSTDGRYHGHTTDEGTAQNLLIVKEKKVPCRILTEEDWSKVVAAPDDRVELCKTLGKPI